MSLSNGKEKKVTYRLPPVLHAKLENIALRTTLSANEMAVYAVEQFVRQFPIEETAVVAQVIAIRDARLARLQQEG